LGFLYPVQAPVLHPAGCLYGAQSPVFNSPPYPFYCIAAFHLTPGQAWPCLGQNTLSMDFLQKLTDQELHYEARFAKQQLDQHLREVERISNLLYGNLNAPPVLTCVPSWITSAINDHITTLEAINLECARRYTP